MRALVWDGTTARVVDRAPPSTTAGMAVVEVRCAGICNTDLEITKGYAGFRGTLGHEFVGDVVEGPPVWLGRRVVGEINFACGGCSTCVRGLGRHCPARTVMGIVGADGALAERVAVPVANLHAVDDRVGDEEAVFVEPLAAAYEILEQVRVVPRTAALVFGDGKLGLLVAQVLHQAGARVVAVGRHEEKLALLRAQGIATEHIPRAAPGQAGAEAGPAQPAWTGEPAELVVEATGTAEGFAAAVRATRPRGTLVLKSTVAGLSSVHLAELVVQEITVVGSRCGLFEPALRALETRSVDVRPLVSARVPLERAEEALRLAAAPGALKVLVTR
ncbi:alcohol dehydrogenase [Sorangium cellulosum]|uniref:Alcohol dehydrogenase n=1 Tax=Sorangium cellulosum TaxID=56 RepID=A0A2L0EZS8_SORCE|nr:alcohol dehydrogenase catalytic domain-containing protein [Sorangium cellulosum]AUX44790.1 alcohol dehydrogenase [Sorangium cellulosum]